MKIDLEVQCPKLPKIPDLPSINILGLAELKGFLDFSQGSPKDCTLAINLMAQIAPLLASLTCLLKILAVVQALKDTVESGFIKTGDLLSAIGELVPCFGALTPLSIAITIKGILELIISFLLCFIEQLESLISFQASLQIDTSGNPLLEATLGCASENGQAAMDNLFTGLGAIKPLLDMVTSIGGVAGIELELPDIDSISAQVSAGEDIENTITSLRESIESLQQAIEALPL